jgi:hypothetical protein
MEEQKTTWVKPADQKQAEAELEKCTTAKQVFAWAKAWGSKIGRKNAFEMLKSKAV